VRVCDAGDKECEERRRACPDHTAMIVNMPLKWQKGCRIEGDEGLRLG